MDAIFGPSNAPNSLALLDVIGAAGVPMVSLAGSSSIIDPPEGNRRGAFKLIPSERIATTQIVDAMLRANQRTLGQIGFATSLGDGSGRGAVPRRRMPRRGAAPRARPAPSSIR